MQTYQVEPVYFFKIGKVLSNFDLKKKMISTLPNLGRDLKKNSNRQIFMISSSKAAENIEIF